MFVERDRTALRALEENLDTLNLRDRSKVITSDAMATASAIDCDIVLADPPYGFEAWAELLRVVRADLVVAESGRSIDCPDGWKISREKKYGRTVVTFFERAELVSNK